MGLIDRWKNIGFANKIKENNNEDLGPLLEGTIKKEPSEAMVIPKDDSVLDDLEKLVKKLNEQSFISVISTTLLDNDRYRVALEYKGESFDFFVGIEDFQLPELFRIGHDFTDNEIEVMESAKRGLNSQMVFGDNNSESYHLQIKLLCAMVEEPAGIVDFSAEKMLSGRWARLAGESEVPPSPDYLYTVQAVSSKDGKVWLHTHGLHRCGVIDLEIIDSDKENYEGQAVILCTLASRMISEGKFCNEYEPFYVMRLTPEVPLVATWVSWHRAVTFFPHNIIGGKDDRLESHNKDTGVVYLYQSKEDADNKKISHVCIYNDLYDANVMQMITSEETDRMKNLALERLGYMIGLFEDRESFDNMGVIVKVGLEVDDEFKDGDMKEHIWFLVKDIDVENETFEAELTQEPYYVASLKPGDIRTCTFDEITDWVVYVDGEKITPDSVYRLTEG